MLQTRVTEMLKIKYPIMQGGMKNLAMPELAAAVSNAGGLGTINAGNYPDIPSFVTAIRKVKSLTGNPFAVNVSMVPSITPEKMIPEYFRVIAAEGVAAVETAGRSPREYAGLLKSAGIILIHKAAAVKFAKKAEEAGADIVSMVGFECGGLPGMDEVGSIVLGNKTAKELKIPVLIAGGIADGRGLVAALALGAEGVVMGTRFIATKECMIHPNFKDWIVKASENDTNLILKSYKSMSRVMRNGASESSLEMEKQGATIEELKNFSASERWKNSQIKGDVDGVILAVGQAIGLIDEIKSVKEVMEDIERDATAVIKKFRC